MANSKEGAAREARQGKRGQRPPAMVWRRVKPALQWQPREGQTLVGYFGGFTQRNGQYGPYQVGKVYKAAGKAAGRAFLVSGRILMDLLESVRVGAPVKVRYLGKKLANRGYLIHDFALYEGLTEEEIAAEVAREDRLNNAPHVGRV